MKYYFNNPKEKFTTILVSDFYTLKPLEAQKAYFVIGSNVYGPMGEELIPFKTKEDAEVFMQEHYGKKIIRFDEIKEDYLY
jgi:nitrous oxide reductase accessory protein NosL